jgi:hypothetical protein
MNALDINVSRAIDGTEGGSYAPSNPIVIAGEGMRFDASLEIGEAGRFVAPGTLALLMQATTFETTKLRDSNDFGGGDVVAFYGYSSSGEYAALESTALLTIPPRWSIDVKDGDDPIPRQERFLFLANSSNQITEGSTGIVGRWNFGTSGYTRAAVGPNGVGLSLRHNGNSPPNGTVNEILGNRTTDYYESAPSNASLDWSGQGQFRFPGPTVYFEKEGLFLVFGGGGIVGDVDPDYINGGTIIRSTNAADGTWLNAAALPADWVNNDRDVFCVAQSPTCIVGPARVNQGPSFDADGALSANNTPTQDGNAFLRSTDGVNFTQGTFPISMRGRAIGYDSTEQVFLCGGHDSKLVRSVDDGVNWTDITPSFTNVSTDKLCWTSLKAINGVWFGVLMAFDYDQAAQNDIENIGCVIVYSFDQGATWRFAASPGGKIGPHSTQVTQGRFCAAVAAQVPRNPVETRDVEDNAVYLMRSLGGLGLPDLF